MAHNFVDIVHPDLGSDDAPATATVAEEAFEQTYRAKGWVLASEAGQRAEEAAAAPGEPLTVDAPTSEGQAPETAAAPDALDAAAKAEADALAAAETAKPSRGRGN
jgi:hypothetical protein